jgi:hypothetical protein
VRQCLPGALLTTVGTSLGLDRRCDPSRRDNPCRVLGVRSVASGSGVRAGAASGDTAMTWRTGRDRVVRLRGGGAEPLTPEQRYVLNGGDRNLRRVVVRPTAGLRHVCQRYRLSP